MRKSSLGRRSVKASIKKSTPQRQEDNVFGATFSGATFSGATFSSRLTTPCFKSGERTARPFTMSTDSRRSSTNSKVKKDIRPLGEKEWQQETSYRIMSYIALAGEVQTILGNVKNLRNMSTDIFLNIFNFLIGKLDGKVTEMNKANYISQVPVLMKKLEYPNKLDKSFLQTVNTQHNYGFVLGIFDYLLTLVQAKEICYEHDWSNLFVKNEPDDDNVFDSQELFNFAMARFEEEMRGIRVSEGDPCFRQLLESAGLSDALFDEITLKQSVLRAKKEQLEQELNNLKSLKLNQAELKEKTIEKEKATAEAALKLEELKQKIWEAETSYDDIVREITSLENKLSQLTTVENQRMTVKDEIAEKVADREQRSELNKVILEGEAYINDLEDIIHTFDISLIPLQDMVNKNVAEYNQLALKVAVEVADELEFPLDAVLIPTLATRTTEQTLAAFEAGKSVIEIVTQTVNKCDESLIRFETSNQELMDGLKNLKEEIQSKTMELAKLNNQVAVEEESFKAVCEHYKTELARKKEDNKSLRMSSEALKKQHDDKAEAVKALVSRVERFKEKLANYKQNCAKKVEILRNMNKNDYEKLKKLMKPENVLKMKSGT